MISTMIIQAGMALQEMALTSANEVLSASTNITFGCHTRQGKKSVVIRYPVQSRRGIRRAEVSIISKHAQEMIPQAKRNVILRNLIKECKREREEIITMLSSKEPMNLNQQGEVHNTLFNQFPYSYEDFLKLNELNDLAIVNGYRYGRYTFRSKSEMVIAQLLDRLGLEYKYEPIITIKGKTRYPDFAVYCPEIGRFFFIEHLGMMDQMKYKMDNLEKMELYESVKIRNGVDIIYTTEFGRGTLDSRAVLGKIMGLVIAQNGI